uniref:Lcl C-terminal domain-containing protein n=1 Tax=Candidatus Electronema sp. TaxID=2698783 RepID=UPI004055D4EA
MPASPQKTEGNLVQLLAVLEANTTLLAFFFGLCFVAALLVLAIWFPQPTAFQYTVFRITLALAAAGIAGIIPGMIRLTVKPGTALLIHAGGALAVFVMVYLLAPASLQMEQPAPPQKEKSAVPKAASSPPPSSPLEKPVESKVVQQVRVSSKADAVEKMPSTVAQEKITIGQYIDNRDDTITDTKTGLMWKRCSEGLSGLNCEEGKVEEYTWDDAVKRFKNVQYAGCKDWRMPTIDELKTLIYCSKGRDKDDKWCNNYSEQPTINQQVFPNTSIWYWSGSPNALDSGDAWYVGFSSGNSGIVHRHNDYAVRLVRGGQ